MKHQGNGHGRRHGATRRKRNRAGFLKPCLLMQLYSKDLHGYDLLLGLQKFIPDADGYDPSIIYRVMRDMEANNLVSSYEGTVSRGPKRRMYSLTEKGTNQLHNQMTELKKRQDEIHHLLTVYQQETS